MELKPGYKHTEVGVIPHDWNSVPLHLLTTEIGDGIHATPIYSSSGDYYFINGNNLHEGRIIITEDTKAVDYSEFNKYRKDLGDNSILMSINGTIGNLGLFAGEAVILGKSAAYLNVKRNVSKIFTYYSLQTEQVRSQFFDGLTGSTIKNLGLDTIRNTHVALPPTIAEQHAIAAALSDVDALITSLDKLIAKKRLFKQAAMQQLLNGKTRLPGFGKKWKNARLGDIAEIVMGQSPSSTHYNTKGVGLPLIQGNADIHNRKTIKRVFTTEVTKLGHRGDIIMSVRAPVGEISRSLFDVCLGRGVCAIRFPNDFLYYALIAKETSWGKLSKGSTFDSVTSKDVNDLLIELPTDEKEQIAIASILFDMDEEIAALEQRRDKIRLLKQGMMQVLLTGKTRLI